MADTATELRLITIAMLALNQGQKPVETVPPTGIQMFDFKR
jgi:hypothetical protein